MKFNMTIVLKNLGIISFTIGTLIALIDVMVIVMDKLTAQSQGGLIGISLIFFISSLVCFGNINTKQVN